MHVYRKIIALTKPYWHRVLLGIILGLLVSGLNGAIVWYLKYVVDVVMVGMRYEYINLVAFGTLMMYSTKGILQFSYAMVMKSSAMKLVRDTQNKLHSHILYIPVRYFHKEASGIVISRVINDVRMLSTLFTEVIQTTIIQIPTIIVLLGIAFYRKWDLTLMILLLFPFIAFSTKRFGKGVKKRTFEAQKKISFLTHRLSETIAGAKIIKVFNRETNRDKKFVDENQRVYRELMKVVRLKESTKLFIDVFTGISLGLVIWYGGNNVSKGIITTGDFLSIIFAISMIFPPVKKLGDAYNFLQEIKAAIERIETVLFTSAEDTGTREIKSFREGIQYDHVSFAYEDTHVLRDIDLTIKAGEVVALVGPSGAGKTTFVDLIPRFYNPSEGSIKIDGINIREINLHSLRNLIGIVSQDIILFNDTIKENIAFGNTQADFSDIKRAAEMAFANEFVEKLADQYETVIGERGMTLSGGQRQRIAIARAILKNPPILILDEATSSLDTVSESLVQQALEGLMKDRTTIIIAHRLSTVINADRIVVLENGKITSIGKHEELIEKSETYTKLYNQLVSSSSEQEN